MPARLSTLLIIDSNPAYAAPAALGFTEALKRVDFSMTLTAAPNETSNATVWGVPMAHAWETWSDARAYDGTATILQPQALPLYQGISMHRMLALFTDPTPMPTLDIVQATWKSRMGANFAQGWHDALANGVVPDTASPKAQRCRCARTPGARSPPAPSDHPLTILFRPDPNLWDGRYANNAWLQELPRPLTKLTWDNPLLISPEHGTKIEAAQRRQGAPFHRRCERDSAGLDHAGPSSGLRRGVSGLRPAGRRYRRERCWV